MNYPPNLQANNPPLTSLRERDWKALTALFERDDSDEIESDIKNNLRWLTPEPCWEDNPFEFLRDYL
ncbi:hypothetical protein VB711_17225 [Cronbergia sp. UHCC 0137]|uniref:hypothetical protein n=1 Tax=Cronbergia sp. UHCC 0137 TaxID=3110239 RepID=UPI002B20E55C|nr:hypothetical protein [Cronbergia sp. UHCC 0137]MEA5619568.1 hypothetical protein [Cronbergia sp. UHCC 0137]